MELTVDVGYEDVGFSSYPSDGGFVNFSTMGFI